MDSPILHQSLTALRVSVAELLEAAEAHIKAREALARVTREAGAR